MADRTRSVDTEFRDSFEEPPYFEDLSERSAVKLTSLLRLSGRPHYRLFTREVAGTPHFKERTGQFIPIHYLELETTDAPVPTRDPVRVDVRIRLGAQRNAAGEVERLVNEAWTDISSAGPDGRPVVLGRTHKQAVFTSAHPDPARRRVVSLHPSFGLGDVPRRDVRCFTVDDLLAAPPGAVREDDLGVSAAQAWSYQQTDPNRHIHAMEYVRVAEAFATDALAARGRDPRAHIFVRARIVFRRPCFLGEWYRVRAEWLTAAEGAPVVIATIHPLATPDAPIGRPATVVQLRARKALLS
jgi:hypothetical protein